MWLVAAAAVDAGNQIMHFTHTHTHIYSQTFRRGGCLGLGVCVCVCVRTEHDFALGPVMAFLFPPHTHTHARSRIAHGQVDERVGAVEGEEVQANDPRAPFSLAIEHVMDISSALYKEMLSPSLMMMRQP